MPRVALCHVRVNDVVRVSQADRVATVTTAGSRFGVETPPADAVMTVLANETDYSRTIPGAAWIALTGPGVRHPLHVIAPREHLIEVLEGLPR